MYTIFGRTFDESESLLAERYLTRIFLDAMADCGIDHGDDSAAWRTDFSSVTDGWNRDGEICGSAYNDLCPVGSIFA